MYEPDTILELKEPKPDVSIPAREDPDTGRKRAARKEPFPYNRVRVIGRSPIDHGGWRGGDWNGIAATGVIIEPQSAFGPNIDEPLGKLQKLYKVVFTPPEEVIEPVRIVRQNAATLGPSPEEQFAAEAEKAGIKPTGKRERTPFGQSPLGEVEDETKKSPLDE